MLSYSLLAGMDEAGTDNGMGNMSIIIMGTGNWGATLAGLTNPEIPVRLWCETEKFLTPTRDRLKEIAGAQRSSTVVETVFSSPLTKDDIVLVVVPSSQIKPVAQQIRDHGEPPYPVIVTASKGLERATFRTMSQVISAIIPEATVAVLSGPNIASEIAAGRPAKAVLGCEDIHILLRVAKTLRSDRFHLEMTRDTVDVELCAAMKGVFAIGAGVIAARNMGCNFMGLLMAAGLHEISEIGRFLGISTDHVFGVAGLGDLVATCFSSDSRNFRLGQLLAQNVSLKDALKEVHMVVEGAMTAAAVAEMGTLRLHLPLFAAIAAIVENPGESTIQQFERTLLDYPNHP